MITGHIMMATTLDGFVARKDHSLDWLMKHDTTNEDHGFVEFMDSIDVLVMGSGSFKTVLGFDQWPYEKPVIVLSRSLTQSDILAHLKDKVEISTLAPKDLMAKLEARGHKRIYVDGGAIIQSFLRDGLIQTMNINIVPILIGDGIRIFSTLDADIDLTLTGVKKHPSGMVDMLYSVQ